MAKPDFTPEFLKTQVRYCPQTGEFVWLISRGRAKAGGKAGGVDVHGYCRIKVLGRYYATHRLAWYYQTGEWPEEYIDHRNGVSADNRWVNLRACSNSENQQNQAALKSSTASGHIGISWHSRNKMWVVRVGVRRSRVHVGYFHSLDDAKEAYLAAKKRYHLFQPVPRDPNAAS